MRSESSSCHKCQDKERALKLQIYLLTRLFQRQRFQSLFRGASRFEPIILVSCHSLSDRCKILRCLVRGPLRDVRRFVDDEPRDPSRTSGKSRPPGTEVDVITLKNHHAASKKNQRRLTQSGWDCAYVIQTKPVASFRIS